MTVNGNITKYKIHVPETHDNIIIDLFRKKRGIIQSSILMRTNALKIINGYKNETYPEDYDLYFRLGKIGRLHNVSDALVGIRIHKSFSYYKLNELLKGYDKIRKNYHKFYNIRLSDIKESRSENFSIINIQKGIFHYINNRKFRGLFYLAKGLLVKPA